MARTKAGRAIFPRVYGTQIGSFRRENLAFAGCDKLGCNVFRRKAIVMIDPKVFEEFSARLSRVIAASPVADIEKNARALLSSFFAKLDLVSREEFDIQAQVLLRTREKLKALEERVARLETQNHNKG